MITHLYIKTHNATGLKYFGKTVKDPFKYNGSGTYWKHHLKIHGSHISTKIIASFEEDQREELVEFALFFSEFYNIVESNEWANLIPENGIDGAVPGISPSLETKKNMSKAKKGKRFSKKHRTALSKARIGKSPYNKGIPCKEETKNKLSKYWKGKPLSKEHIQNQIKSKLGSKIITNGIINKRPIVDENFIMPEGWWFGKKNKNLSIL